jgi:hypothetical protein
MRPPPVDHLGAECCARLRPVLGQGDHVGVVRRNFFADAGDAGTAAVLDVPGEEDHKHMSRKNSADLDLAGFVLPDESVEGIVRDLLVPLVVDQFIRPFSAASTEPPMENRRERNPLPARGE